MNDRIHELLHRNLQEVFGEGDAVRRRASIDELYTEDCVLYVPSDVPPGTFVGVKPSTNLLVISVRPTALCYTPHGEPQLFTMPAVWPGAPAHAAKRPNTPAWM